jgi:hypothetical protein
MDGTITVVNKRTHVPTDRDVYVGRGSALGNPYTHRSGTKALFICSTREVAIDLCRDWLLTQVQEKNPAVCAALNDIYRMAKTGDVNLVCYCAPKACHGDVIKALIEAKLKKTE